MRQVLFRIHVDSLFSFTPIDGVFAVGLIVVFAAWCIYGTVLFRQLVYDWADRTEPVDVVSPIVVWTVIAGLILSLPLWASSLLPAGIPIYGYGLMVFLGFATGGWLAAKRAGSVGLNPEIVWDLLMWVFIAGIGGARLFYLIQYRDRIFSSDMSLPQRLFTAVNLSDGGLVLFGGVLMVVVAMVVFSYRNKISPLLMADIVVPSFFVGLMFGRIGCLLNGCCFGDRCELPWGIQFPAGSVPFSILVERGFLDPASEATFPLHPTQIYSSLNAGLLALVTSALFRLRPPHGAVLAFGLMTYPITRFLIEFIRGDEMGKFGTGLTISQLLSLGMVAAGAVLAAWVWRELWLKSGPGAASPAA
ncbi:prolipoprotein diacylglyceryl transferase [Calycomorphotria hydatis]|uniref:Phosphatidylglycerol--prolipoprotein diacylglyceryl transferase n=1 Tax=Calycomorphotria hydatis TaxID=2528027 RepID=A0A517TCR2_9PLAN|nr:prolipoprotein diacylglyceryl transferase [Calycomorphotria hydatis]QDT66157.1 Prolipoprotein diacylglyceryl transferase [Calycomorphotria hydatis]